MDPALETDRGDEDGSGVGNDEPPTPEPTTNVEKDADD